MRKVAIGRIIGLAFVVICSGAALWCARDALQSNASYHRALTARPMEVVIDLSQPGVTTVPFHQTYSSSHGEELYLDTDLDRESLREPEDLFQDFTGNIAIRDSNGNETISADINDETIHTRNGQIMLASFLPFRRGEYSATIRIDSGASNFAGTKQIIYARYQLCGLEQFPALISGAFAIGAGCIAFFGAASVLPGLVKYGLWHDQSAQDATSNRESNIPTADNESF